MNSTCEQQEFIEATYNCLKLVANPGSGKTRTIIYKYKHMIDNNIIAAKKTILISFTNKSADEIMIRLNKINTPIPQFVGTFHKFCLNQIQKYTKNHFIINDDDYIDNILTKIIKKFIPEYNNNTIRLIKNIIDYSKTFYPNNIFEAYTKNKDKLKIEYKLLEIICNEYSTNNIKSNRIDIGDILQKFADIITNNTNIKNKIMGKLDCIFFDEFQDTNMIQNYILKILHEKAKLIVVGDSNQAIYSFRGANSSFLNNLEAKKYILTRNFRSTKCITTLLNNIYVDSNNVTNKRLGSKPVYINYNRDNNFIGGIILDLINSNKDKNILIIGRYNNTLEKIEKYFIDKKIKYNYNKSLLTKKHVIIFITLLQLLCKRNNMIKDYIISNYNIDINTINNIKDINDIYIFIKKKCDMKEMKDIDYLYNLYNKSCIRTKNQIIDFINSNRLDGGTIEYKHNITLSTIHAAKGLEYDYVYFILDGLGNKIKNDTEYIDEKNLFYVGCSRAKQYLYLLNINEKNNIFINELNPTNYR